MGNRGSFRKRSKVPVIGGNPVDFCAVYAIGPEKGRPIKIGYGHDLEYRLSGIQTGNWIKLMVHFNVWVVDLMLARRIELACHSLLDKVKKRISGEWFDVTADWAKKVILFAGHQEKIPFYTNKDLASIMVAKEDWMTAEFKRRANLFGLEGVDGGAAALIR